MARAEVDLKTLIDQNRSQVLEILEAGNTLIFEIKAEHRWTTHALETYSQLKRIMGNLAILLEKTEPDWEKGEKLFKTDNGLKLWKTTVALWRALPPIMAKYTGILAKRRRQRIMGMEIIEVEEFEPETIERELENLTELNDEILGVLKQVQSWSGKLPDGLAPDVEDLAPAEQPKAEPAPETAEAAEKTAADGGTPPPAAGDTPPEEPEQAQPVEKVADDELSPV